MGSMVDAQVLSYAFFSERGKDAAHNLRIMASRVLIGSLDRVCVSAVTWAELWRVQEFREILKRIERKVHVLSLDAAVAEKAAELLERYRRKESVCGKCLNSLDTSECPACGSRKSNQQRFSDALMVTTASLSSQIGTLYAYDGGVLKLGKVVSGCDVRNPPNPSGPMFEGSGPDTKAEDDGKVVPIPKRSKRPT